ncbi:uncharacterized protein LOC129778862 [Toxorhynchites rutilus septentrionalis]|uniref:uncharacterized protein LOC129778862 n=1 Tax=Toxorhynchites rutilus septentrionalis TaxID=329112 RepID=UPI00247964C8|nr:uncharacterized protein LOC129778862 [Toxorhynchites rutilus septentrionalis]
MNRLAIVLAVVIAAVVPMIEGHGTVRFPPQRSTRWRCNPNAPPNWNDNEVFCGGFMAQWEQNGGRCGVCGDNYADPKPRDHELGGRWGQGEIVANYTAGSVITVDVLITANHRGHFEFKLCCLDNSAETEECFNQHLLEDNDGRHIWHLNSTMYGMYHVPLQLPRGLVCERAVLQWTYVTGNRWGECPDGPGDLGCGPQEHFRTCSDIGIYHANDERLKDSFDFCRDRPVERFADNWVLDNIPEEYMGVH